MAGYCHDLGWMASARALTEEERDAMERGLVSLRLSSKYSIHGSRVRGPAVAPVLEPNFHPAPVSALTRTVTVGSMLSTALLLAASDRGCRSRVKVPRANGSFELGVLDRRDALHLRISSLHR